MALGMEVGLGPGHIVLDGDPAPLPKEGGRIPNFRRIFIAANCLQYFYTVGWAAARASGLYKMWGWWRWALVSPDGVAPSRMVC